MSEPKPMCIYHGNCADGFTAAWAVWMRFGDAWDYYPGVYQSPPPDVAGRDVVFVDFSYKRDVLYDMRRSAKSILVLDHHKTACDDLTNAPCIIGMGKWEVLNWDAHAKNIAQDEMENALSHIYAYFDMNRSGAGIAWDFFHPNDTRSKIVNYAEDRDLWRFALPKSREVSAVIFSFEYEFGAWTALDLALCGDFEKVVSQGAAIERKHHKDVAELVAAFRREMIIGSQWVPVANLPYTLTSDAGHLMCQPYASPNLQGEMVAPPFAACYWDTAEGRVFSLRSIEGGADVSEIAKQYGGGGHKNAAGFRLPHGAAP